MLRSVLSVVGGLALIVVLAFGGDMAIVKLIPDAFDPATGSLDTGILVFLLFYIFAVTTFGTWVTARVAADRPMAHALALGVLALSSGALATIWLWHAAPAWYHLTSLADVLPAACLGGAIATHARRREAAVLAPA